MDELDLAFGGAAVGAGVLHQHLGQARRVHVIWLPQGVFHPLAGVLLVEVGVSCGLDHV